MDHLGASKISVQRYTGSYWRTEYNFTYSEYPELQGENVGRHSGTVVLPRCRNILFRRFNWFGYRHLYGKLTPDY